VDDYTQTAFVTRDMDASIRNWHAIGAGPFYIVDLSGIDSGAIADRTYRGAPARDTFRAAIGFLGTTQIELIDSTNEAPSVFREIPAAHGDALHHMQARVSVVTPALFDRCAGNYEALGMPLVATMTTPAGARTAFYDARATVGCFLELVEKSEHTFACVRLMHEAHLRQRELPMIMPWPAP